MLAFVLHLTRNPIRRTSEVEIDRLCIFIFAYHYLVFKASSYPDIRTVPRLPEPSAPGSANSCLCPKCPSATPQPVPLRRAARCPFSLSPPLCHLRRQSHNTSARSHKVCQCAYGTLHPAATSPAPGYLMDIPARTIRS